MYKYLIFAIIWCLPISCSVKKSIGAFVTAQDVGNVLHEGSTSYDSKTRIYKLSGSGSNMWFDRDEFHFAYKKLTGDVSIAAQGNLIGEGVDPHRKFGLMFRSSLDTDAAMIIATVHGDGLASVQYRKVSGQNVEEQKSTIEMPDQLSLERRGTSFVITLAKVEEPIWTSEVNGFDFPKEMYVGLFVCSHNADVIEQAIFKKVRIKNLK